MEDSMSSPNQKWSWLESWTKLLDGQIPKKTTLEWLVSEASDCEAPKEEKREEVMVRVLRGIIGVVDPKRTFSEDRMMPVWTSN